MDKNQFNLKDVLDRYDAYNIVGHIRPDGDTIGSQVALCLMLQKLGKQCFIIDNYDLPPCFYDILCGIKRIKISEIDLALPLICCDCSDFERTGNDVISKFDRPFLNIDHHISNNFFAEINIVYPSASSTCEIIADMIINQNLPLDYDISRFLYVGILTDTGRFAYEATTARTFQIAEVLVQHGVSPVDIFSKIFTNERIERYRLLERFLKNIDADFGNNICISQLSVKDFNETGASWSDAEGFVDYTRNLAGINVGVFLEFRDDFVKGSLRASDKKFRLDLFAAKFNGGGHPCAAGFNFKCSSENFLEYFKSLLIEHLKVIAQKS